MTIRFTCPNRQCGRSVGAPDNMAGQEGRCPYCEQVLRIPAKPGKEPVLDERSLAGLADGISLEAPEPGPKKARKAAVVHMDSREKAVACPRCGTIYPANLVCPQCRGTPAPMSLWERIPVGKIISVVIGLAVLGGLAGGVLWVIKSIAEQGSTYFQKTQDVKQIAYDVTCMEQLRVLGTDIQIYYTTSDHLPATLAELNRRDLLHCPAPNGQEYQYVPGQRTGMPGSNILVYEPIAAHNLMHAVLRLDGQTELMTTEQLQAALVLTQESLAR